MTQHALYPQAYLAYANMSFSPEKRAADTLSWYDAQCAEFIALGKEAAIEKFTQLYLKSLAAQARLASPMITGPANFPVARMQKYHVWADKANKAMYDFIAKVKTPPKEKRHELDYNIEAKEYTIAGVLVRHNVEENRLQLIFDGKPSLDMISKLKKNGYKWSPRNKAWQRQLTPNAVFSLYSVLEV